MVLTYTEIENLIDKYYSQIFINNEIPKEIICGQVTRESAGDTNAFANDSNGGSYGLMQVDQTALSDVGYPTTIDLKNSNLNVQVGMNYDLQFYNGKHGNSDINNLTGSLKIAMSLLSYNCGPENFEELYKNHLTDGNIQTWEDAINNENLVSNWINCLKYPQAIFYFANQYYGLKITKTINNDWFEFPCVIF